MEFDWDEGKNVRNVAERGLPFSLAESLFQNSTFEVSDNRRDYGEQRIRAYGILNHRLLVCVYTDRMIEGRFVRWVISLRRANVRETKKYYEWIESEDSG